MTKIKPEYMTVDEMVEKYEDLLLLVSIVQRGKPFEDGEVVMIGVHNETNYREAFELLYADLDGYGYIYVAVRDGGEIFICAKL